MCAGCMNGTLFAPRQALVRWAALLLPVAVAALLSTVRDTVRGSTAAMVLSPNRR